MKTDVILSNAAIRPLMKADGLESNKEVIKQHLIAGGECVVLTDKQNELLVRWTFADEMIRTNRGKLSRGEIANIVSNRMNVSLATAKSDMSCAEDVMSSSNPLNKKYGIGLLIEFLEKEIRVAGIANNSNAVAKLGKVLIESYKIYPDTITARPRRQVIYNIQQNIIQNVSLSEQEADDIIELELKKLEEDIDAD